jgi:uncharacterized phage protein (TIGR01671 family)
MAREISFRGKTESGKWIYGSLERRDQVDRIGGYEITAPTPSDPGGDTIWVYENVIRETVGQFTGLPDRTGLDIYEGDVVLEYVMNDLFEVVFTEYANFGLRPVSEKALKYLKGHEYESIDSSYASTSLTVVGNIHDNPEFLS